MKRLQPLGPQFTLSFLFCLDCWKPPVTLGFLAVKSYATQVPFSLCPFWCDSSDSLAHKVKPLPHFTSLSESFGSPTALFKD